MNNPQKQTVYLPVKVQDELPSKNYYDGLHSDCGLVGFENGEFGKWTNRGIWDHPIDVRTWLKPQEMFVFTPEQLNEYTQSVIKQALENAAEKAETKTEEVYAGSLGNEFGKLYNEIIVIDIQSITNTFEETYKKFEV